MKHRFEKLLIANRGEIALRILQTCHRLGIQTVAVYSDADADALHVRLANEAVRVGPPPAHESYLNPDAILVAAEETKADALHPGYGFLSESPSFARACVDQGLVFIGPAPEHIEQFGLKDTARQFAEKIGIPVVPGSPVLKSIEEATQASRRLGYPLLVKDTGGGGGHGMTWCEDEAALRAAFLSSQSRAQTYFQTSAPYLEKYIQRAHHIEVQIFGDGQGGIWVLGERECSIQRRYQKLIEETPSPTIDAALRNQLFEAARRLGEAAGYASAGTVEFLVDEDTGQFYFLEVNTRIQVEHTVTEMVTGLDIVELMILQASGHPVPLDAQSIGSGHAIEARLYAEDPIHRFAPMPGRLTKVEFPSHEWARCDTGLQSGDAIPAYYDPLIAKLIIRGHDRSEAVKRLQQVLSESRVGGTVTNLDYLRQLACSPKFVAADTSTSFTQQFEYTQPRVEVESPGFLLLLQDWPGRVGYWNIGVPPSGPMDPLAFRMANQLLGNRNDCAALECMVEGPVLRFSSDTEIALTGANMEARLDGKPVPFWTAVSVSKGARLEMGSVTDAGYRTY